MVAAYTCSPLVLIPLNELKDDAKVAGRTIGDMGNGQPLNMVMYKVQGEDFLFVTDMARGARVIPIKGLQGAKAYTPDNVPKGMLIDLSPEMPIGPVGKAVMFVGSPIQVDLLNEKFFVALTRSAQSGELTLESLPTFLLPIRLDKIWSEFDFQGGGREKKV